TTGLDPRSRRQVWEIVRSLQAAGTTVLLTTQYMEEADQLAERVIIIDHGTVIANGTIGELKASVGAGTVRVRLHDPQQRDAAAAILAQTLGVQPYLEADPAALSAQASDPELVASTLTRLTGSGIAVSDYALGQPSLDEVFLALTGQPVEDETHQTEEVV